MRRVIIGWIVAAAAIGATKLILASMQTEEPAPGAVPGIGFESLYPAPGDK